MTIETNVPKDHSLLQRNRAVRKFEEKMCGRNTGS